MFKKLIVLAAASLVSMSASAGFIQYDLNNVTFDDGKQLTGFVVRDTTNDAVAFYQLTSFYNIYINGIDGTADNATITVPGGPTSFHVTSNNFMDEDSQLTLTFGPSAWPNTFSVSGFEMTHHLYPLPGDPVMSMHSIVSGTATVGTISQSLQDLLDSGVNYVETVPPALPASVPEPASLALVAAGLGLMGRLRKRKAA